MPDPAPQPPPSPASPPTLTYAPLTQADRILHERGRWWVLARTSAVVFLVLAALALFLPLLGLRPRTLYSGALLAGTTHHFTARMAWPTYRRIGAALAAACVFLTLGIGASGCIALLLLPRGNPWAQGLVAALLMVVLARYYLPAIRRPNPPDPCFLD